MPQNRIFWPVQSVGLAPLGSNSYVGIHGLQTVSMSTTFNLEQVFEIGQAAIYENIENIPDVEVSLEKVIDGYPLMYHLATRGYPSATLIGRQNQRCSLALNTFADTQDSATGTPISQVICSGLYLSSVSYTIPTEGNCTESISLVGNDKVWRTSSFISANWFDNTDQPLALTSGIGGVQRREDVIFYQIATINSASGTVLPTEIPGINANGVNVLGSDGVSYNAAVQSISVSADLGREAINQLGFKGPYTRYANFPVEVRTEIEVISKSGDFIGATETSSLSNQTIIVQLRDSTRINLGTRNKLNSVNYGGADAGGGNATVTYSYVTYNDLTVSHNQDPT